MSRSQVRNGKILLRSFRVSSTDEADAYGPK
jgi:hypothetical protein